MRQATALPSMNVFGPGILTLAQGLTLGFTVFDHMWYTPTDTGVPELFLATNVEQVDDQGLETPRHDRRRHLPRQGRESRAEDPR